MAEAVRTYRLEAKVDDQWRALCTIEAVNHRRAFRTAMTSLPRKRTPS